MKQGRKTVGRRPKLRANRQSVCERRRGATERMHSQACARQMSEVCDEDEWRMKIIGQIDSGYRP